MPDLRNPYIAGAPVTEASMFFGREDVFNWIERSLPGRYVDHILVIHGQRRVGKTSVLKQLPNWLPDGYIPVFFDLQGRTRAGLDRFLWWLARETTRALKQDRGISMPIPSKEGFKGDTEYLEGVFIPEVQAALGDHNLLLTFDEFDSLEEEAVKETLASPLIEKLGQLTGVEGLNFIFSIGSSGRKLENMQASYTEFFKAALYKEISFLGMEDTRRLIAQPVTDLLHYEQAAIDRIYAIASGHPYFTQLICHELFSHHQETGEREIHQRDVEAVLEDVVERGTVNLKFVWDEASDLEKWILAGLAQADQPIDNSELVQILQVQRVRFATQNFEAALLHLREKDVLTQDNQFVIQLMRLWLRKNRPLERVRQELVELNPIASRYIEIGLEYKSAQEHDRALESFKEALRVDPENIQAHVNLGDVLMDQSDWPGAIEAYQSALTLDDEDVAAKAGLCEAYLALGDQALKADRAEEAVRSYRQVLGINSEHTEARQRMADIHSERAERSTAAGKFDRALSHYRKALEYTPEDLSLETRYEGLLQEHRDRVLRQLQEQADKAIAGGKWEQASRALEEARHLAPDDDDIQNKLAAARAAQRAQELKNLRAQAERQAREEDWEQAIRSLQAYIKMDPEDRQAAEGEIERLRGEQQKGQIYLAAQEALAAKDYDQAVQLLKRIVFEDETYKEAARLLAQAIESQRITRRRIPLRWLGAVLGAIAIAALGFWLAQPSSPLRSALSGLSPQPSSTPEIAITATALPTTRPTSEPAPTATPDWREEYTSSVVWTASGREADFQDDFSADTLDQRAAWGLPAEGVSVTEDAMRHRSDGDWTTTYLPVSALDFIFEVDITPYLVTSDYTVVLSFRVSDESGYDLFLTAQGSSIKEWALELSSPKHVETIASGGGIDLEAGEKGNLLLAAVGDRITIIAGTKRLIVIDGAEDFGEEIIFGVKAPEGGTIEVAFDNISMWNLEPQWMGAFLRPVLDAVDAMPPSQELTFPGNSATGLPSVNDPDVSVQEEHVIVRYENRYDNFHHWFTNNYLLKFDFMLASTTNAPALDVTLRRPLSEGSTFTHQFRLNLDTGGWELSASNESGTSVVPVERWGEFALLALGDQFVILLDGVPLLHQRDTGRVDRITIEPPHEISLDSREGVTELAIDNIRLWDLNGSSVQALGENWVQDLAPDLDSILGTDPSFSDDFSATNPRWNLDHSDFVVQAEALSLTASGSSGIYGNTGLINAEDFMLEFDFSPTSESPDGAFGLELRGEQDAGQKNESYLFELDLTTGGYVIRHNFSPDIAYHPEIVSGMALEYDPQRTNQMRVVALEDRIGFYLNDLPLTYFSDQRANGERNGFFIASYDDRVDVEVLIDNLRFWELTED